MPGIAFKYWTFQQTGWGNVIELPPPAPDIIVPTGRDDDWQFIGVPQPAVLPQVQLPVAKAKQKRIHRDSPQVDLAIAVRVRTVIAKSDAATETLALHAAQHTLTGGVSVGVETLKTQVHTDTRVEMYARATTALTCDTYLLREIRDAFSSSLQHASRLAMVEYEPERERAVPFSVRVRTLTEATLKESTILAVGARAESVATRQRQKAPAPTVAIDHDEILALIAALALEDETEKE